VSLVTAGIARLQTFGSRAEGELVIEQIARYSEIVGGYGAAELGLALPRAGMGIVGYKTRCSVYLAVSVSNDL